MGLTVSKYPKNLPKSWPRYDRELGGPPPRAFGFIDDAGEVNRFAARYRLAKSFSEVTFDGYSISTSSGYEGLMRLFFAWSAFEQYLKIAKRKQSDIDDLLGRYDSKNLITKIRQRDKGSKYFKFVCARTNAVHKKQLERYFKKHKFNVTYLASSIRHVFVHGPLTPNADQVDPDTVRVICNYLSKFLIYVMDHEFTSHIDDYEQMMKEVFRKKP